MTTKNPLPANFGQTVPTDPVRRFAGDCGYFKVWPAKGARVAGLFAVTTSSEDRRVGPPWETLTLPAVVVDCAPTYETPSGSTRYENGSAVHHPLTVNGVEYKNIIATVWVKFHPVERVGNRDGHYPRITVDGRDGYLIADGLPWDDLTDNAKRVLSATAEAIAAQWLTAARWHAHKIHLAEYTVKRAEEKFNKAQTELDVARLRLDMLKIETVA